ncbi:MAG: PAS-domain containing protein [Chloroflexota bacterium]
MAAFARIGTDWLWETDADGRFVYFSADDDGADGRNGPPRLGRTRREAAAADPENLARLAELDELIAKRQPFRDVIYRAQAGLGDRPAWCAISGEPVFDETGTFRGYRGIGRDVDALVEAQRALETKTRILDALLAAVPDAIRILDARYQTLSVNEQFYELFKLDKAEMLQAPDGVWYSLLEMARRGEYGPGDPEALARARYALLGLDAFHYERRLKHGSWIEARDFPLQGGGWIEIYRDITERKEAEQALKQLNATLERRVQERTAALTESERFNRATIDSISARLAVVDGDGQILETNAAWQRFAEQTRSVWHTARDGENYLAACDQAIQDGAAGAWATAGAIREIVAGERKSFEVEYPFSTLQGERYFVCRVARVGEDGPIRIVVTHDDVTPVRQAEQQVWRAQRLEAIETLAGGIAHDLNNALTPIVMGLELLRAEVNTHAETVEMMHTAADRGAEMVRQLLTFARSAEGQRILVQPAVLIDEVARIAEGTLPSNTELSVRVQANLPMVQGDPTQLHQVLLNLCANARAAMPSGGTLTLAAEVIALTEEQARSISGARVGQFVRLTVRDTGTGIASSDLDRIFDPFFTTREVDLGTGLGLSTALGIVRAHGGFFQVTSLLGRGSTFDAYLPVAGAVGGVDAVAEAPTELRGQGQVILVVDDEAAIRQLYRTVLERLGFRAVTAVDGADGLVQVARLGADLAAIVTDVRMPNMDGLAFVRALHERDARVPIAIATGRIEEWQAAELDQLQITARLSKPFTQKRLMGVLRQLLAPSPAIDA